MRKAGGRGVGGVTQVRKERKKEKGVNFKMSGAGEDRSRAPWLIVQSYVNRGKLLYLYLTFLIFAVAIRLHLLNAIISITVDNE